MQNQVENKFHIHFTDNSTYTCYFTRYFRAEENQN